MVVEQLAPNFAELINASSPESLSNSLNNLTAIFASIVKAIGGIFVLYAIFLISNWIRAMKQSKMLKEMSEDIKEIKAKLNKK